MANFDEILPVLNLSGDTKDILVEQFAEISITLSGAQSEIRNLFVHPRNYKNMAHYEKAKEDMLRDLKILKDLEEKYMKMAIALDERHKQ